MHLCCCLHPFTDVNECLVNNGDCDHNCTNLVPGHQCSCREGFVLDGDNHTCRGKYVLHMSAATIRSHMRSDRLSALQCLEPMQLLLVALLHIHGLSTRWIVLLLGRRPLYMIITTHISEPKINLGSCACTQYSLQSYVNERQPFSEIIS